ncbi:hypothetical protein [Bacillus sp. FJAT-27445]|uniref:hypothetical protein n=1 Tax=Bacillus sp. FJAT-27445 TaxID=1679166 RepID=UPI0007444759|nr:hypothetical protein [Bacillus sp. FJAT-27445]
MATKTYNRDLLTPSFKQFDTTWGSKITSCGGTMKAEGCIITSVAMLFKGFGDSLNPGTFLDALKPTGADCPFNWLSAANKYGHSYHDKTTGTFSALKGNIFDLIVNKGTPVLIRVPGHTVVAKAFSGTLSVDIDGNPYYSQITASMINVNDPGSSTNVTLQDVINQRGELEYINRYTL